MRFLYKSLSFLIYLAKWFFILIFLITLVGIAAYWFVDISNYPFFRFVLQIEQNINNWVRHYIPSIVKGTDISRYITLVLSVIGMRLARHFSDLFAYKAHVIQIKQSTPNLKRLAATEEGQKKLKVLDEKLEDMQKANRKDRGNLLKEFIQLKKQLESMGRNLAFLSVDVVESTKMKEAEDPLIVSYDFVKYREMVEFHLNANGCIKSAWTPDGLMACFNTLQEALRAGKGIINGLIEFNRSIKEMKNEFAVRCGINYGYLLFDETMPLEQITDRVIDIAGHMQKHAAPNTINVPKNIVMPLTKPEQLQETSDLIDNLEVCIWKGPKN